MAKAIVPFILSEDGGAVTAFNARSPKAQGAAASNTSNATSPRAQAPIQAGSATARVLDFLVNIRGLCKLSEEELETRLFERRVDLVLPPRTPDAEDVRLPSAASLPTPGELNSLLSSGAIPGGHQCVAHVLYPQSIPWPDHKYPIHTASGRMTSSLLDSQQLDIDDVERSPSSSPTGSPMASASTATKELQLGSPRQLGVGIRPSEPNTPRERMLRTRSEEGVHSASNIASATNSPTARSNEAGPDQRQSDSARVSERKGDSADAGDERLDDAVEATFMLRGQKVKTTARGRSLASAEDATVDLSDVTAPSVELEQQQERLLGTQERRRRQEKSARLERHQEKKIEEQIRELEQLRIAELRHEEELRKQEVRRKARREELQQHLAVQAERKAQAEEEKKQALQQEHAREAEEERKRKVRQQHQKEIVDKWCQDKFWGTAGPAAPKASREPSVERRAPKQKTLRQLEYEDKIYRMNLAVEERPPVPPKPHDLPAPILADTAPHSARKAARPVSLTSRMRTLSCNYGLTEKEKAEVRETVLRRAARLDLEETDPRAERGTSREPARAESR